MSKQAYYHALENETLKYSSQIQQYSTDWLVLGSCGNLLCHHSRVYLSQK